MVGDDERSQLSDGFGEFGCDAVTGAGKNGSDSFFGEMFFSFTVRDAVTSSWLLCNNKILFRYSILLILTAFAEFSSSIKAVLLIQTFSCLYSPDSLRRCRKFF
jgi:hypothetical protein